MSTTRTIIEVLKAYADCNNHFDNSLRDLNFKASDYLYLTTAKDILEEAMPNGYNNFEVEKLKFIDDMCGSLCKVWIARESSVCLYIEQRNENVFHSKKLDDADLEYLKLKLAADEITKDDNGIIRIWWD